MIQFAQYIVKFGRGLYRKGRLYRRGDTVVLPVTEKPVKCLATMTGDTPKWDSKKGVVTNATIYGGAPPRDTVASIMIEAQKLADRSNKDTLMQRAHGLGLDVNGTKLDLAKAILAAQAGKLAEDDDDIDDDDRDLDEDETPGAEE